MAATVWSGFLTFGLISIPVRLYSGARGKRISFHMLHRDDFTRVKQQLVCPADEKVVERSETVKGYEYRKGEYVVVEPAEIRKIEPATAKAMEILEFVKQEEIDPVYFESSYYLGPDEGGKKPFALLTRALEGTGYLAVAKLAMHNREYTALLRPYKGGLMLHTMYYQDEIREMPDLGQDRINLKDAEVKVAHQLINALAAKWDPSKYRDAYKENLKKLIKARFEGKQVAAVEKPHKLAPPVDLMEALKQSLAHTAGKKGPQLVEAKEKKAPAAGRPRKKPVRRVA